jgi:hypothetical protein
MKYIYRWNGQYFGFVSGGNLFDANSNWIGWIEGKQVWRGNGTFLGEIYEQNYVLRKTKTAPFVPQIPHIPPVPPVPPVHPINRINRVPVTGMEDALAEYE